MDVKKLKQKRGLLKASLARFKTFLNSVQAGQCDEELVINVQQRLEHFQPTIHAFRDLQDEIELLDPDDIDNSEERLEFEDSYYELISQAGNFIAKNRVDRNTQLGSHVSRPIQSVKLPTINLPVFSGDFAKWREFYDTFITLIHSNSDLTEIQKLSYLRASLRNEPATLVSSLPTTSQNYAIAWETLNSRYNNKRRIINTHVENILSLQPITKDNHSGLRLFLNTIETNLQCLGGMGQAIESWSTLLIPLIIKKLDFVTIKEWEINLNKFDNDHIPTVKEFLEFLSSRADILETIENRKTFGVKPGHSKAFVATDPKTCMNCGGNHHITNCSLFLNLSVEERSDKAKSLRICLNCLNPGHFAFKCKMNGCRYCKLKHNSLLHFKKEIQTRNKTDAIVESNQTSLSSLKFDSSCLLATAQVIAYNNRHVSIKSRALLDSGSQPNLITTELVKRLQLPLEEVKLNISGISNKAVKVVNRTFVTIKSRCTNYSTKISCLVLPKICDFLPSQVIDIQKLEIPSNVVLADEELGTPSRIDILLGSDVFWDILNEGHLKRKNLPSLHNSKLGWVVGGRILGLSPQRVKTFVNFETINEDLKKFWEFEGEIVNTKGKCHSADDRFCEDYFKESTTRDENGRFVVRIPFKHDPSVIGSSYSVAEKRLLGLERRFKKNEVLKKMYLEFMDEYQTLGHMYEIQDTGRSRFYIPHHAVVNTEKTTTKLRVVFDGSCNVDAGSSVNEIQHVGPRLQNDLFLILTNFRLSAVVATADIEKMYRQVIVHPEDRKYQTILWRKNNFENIKHYELATVTYGMTSAPYLAVKCLLELAEEFKVQYPEESRIIRECFYVDDLLTGADTTAELLKCKDNLIKILETAKFNLRKWVSNDPKLCDQTAVEAVPLMIDTHKTLGIFWNYKSDAFVYKWNNYEISNSFTKRAVVSLTAKLFDPLGLVAPVIVIAKLMIQTLWRLGLSWDEPMPSKLVSEWQEFQRQLKFISNISISRYASILNAIRFEFHVFSDASEKAYGACLYLRAVDATGNISIRLLAAKSRVAPLKVVSLPRLELSAAVVAAQLCSRFKQSLKISILAQYLWTDSMIVLGWIKSEPYKYKTFVANRISEIQSLTDPTNWYHVNSGENPADHVSRGMLPEDIQQNSLWWSGPKFLHDHFEPESSRKISLDEDQFPEMRCMTAVTKLMNHDIRVIERFSSLSRLKRVIAYCFRFISNCRASKNKYERQTGPVSAAEQNWAMNRIVLLTQINEFTDDYGLLIANRPLPNSSRILSLAPFIDRNNLIRVGGRLQNCDSISYNQKHPLLIPKNHYLTRLIFLDLHLKLLHGGPKLLVNSVRLQYWPIGAVDTAKLTVRKCIVCSRFNATASSQQMGQLPNRRISMNPPFTHVGIDFAGPVQIKSKKGRGARLEKCYIALFICMSVKAVHLELVPELSTESFLNALKRFVARRGRPSHVYSDNAKNFKGAKNELCKISTFLEYNSCKIEQSLANESISWHFIPPYSPHCGGLWEAGIKSMKHHLRRVLGNSSLTFEEYCTLLTQIEAILNSRPICSLSADPNDSDALTPAHFLIGRPLISLPDYDLTNTASARLNRFQYVQQMYQHLWKRWHVEYVSQLQQRVKWKATSVNLKVGQLVVIKDDNSPPNKWRLGRITEVHPGADGLVRVVSVRCQGQVTRRAITKICALPTNEDNES